MSVVKGKRSVSKLEFFHNAIILRKKITDLLMRDFGIKDYKRDLKFAIKYENFTLEEQETIEEYF